MMQKAIVIAEAGVNHNGDIGIARQLIDVAADAGADFVKFQTFCAERLVTTQARKARYQVNETGSLETQYQMLKKLELSEKMHRDLIEHCRERHIGFLSTGFDIQSVDFLHSLGIRLYKIPSGEVTNLMYLRYVGSLSGEVILSTGMCTLGEIEEAIEVLEKAGTGRDRITVLHCTTEYPTPMHDVNLMAMLSMRSAFGVKVGYSDHTQGIEVAIAAVALGATLIEKHFTLDRKLPGPDHKASLEPAELRTMIASICNIKLALGDGVKRVTASEFTNRSVARRSLVASRKILKGEVFSIDNITAKRPGHGISPMRWDEVIGRSAVRDFSPDELIEL